MEEGDLGECLKHRDGGDGEQKHIPASCWTHSPLLVLQMVWGGRSRLSTSSALTSIWGSLPFVSIPENSQSPSAEMCTCPGKVFLHLSPTSLLDSLLAPCSLLVLPSHCSWGGNSMDTQITPAGPHHPDFAMSSLSFSSCGLCFKLQHHTAQKPPLFGACTRVSEKGLL